MTEPELVVENRGHLWNLLMAAETLEHLILCQYLYASFSLKTDPDEGLTAVQAEAVSRWRKTLTGIAIEEMLHLALVANVMTAIGAAPPSRRSLNRVRCPRRLADGALRPVPADLGGIPRAPRAGPILRPGAAGHPGVHPPALRHRRPAAAADRAGYPDGRRAVQPRI